MPKKTGIVKDQRYLQHSAGAYHPESPERLAAVHAMLESDRGVIERNPTLGAEEKEQQQAGSHCFLSTGSQRRHRFDHHHRDEGYYEFHGFLLSLSYSLRRILLPIAVFSTFVFAMVMP